MLSTMFSVSRQMVSTYSFVARQVVMEHIGRVGFGDVFQDNVRLASEDQTPASTQGPDGKPVLGSDTRFTYEQRVSLNSADLEWNDNRTNSFEPNYPWNWAQAPIDFLDSKINACLRTLYKPVLITLECVAHFRHRSPAYEFLSALHSDITSRSEFQCHDVIYHVEIPSVLLGVMYQLYSMQGYVKEGFRNYVEVGSGLRITKAINKNLPKSGKPILRKHISGVRSQIKCDIGEPEVVKNDQVPIGYRVPYQIKFQFARPETLFFRYPPVIKNQLVPDSCIFLNRDDVLPKTEPVSPFISEHNYRNMMEGQWEKPISPVRAPWYDFWVLPNNTLLEKLHYAPIFVGLVLLDHPSDQSASTIIDFTNLGEFKLVDAVLDKLKNTPSDKTPLWFHGNTVQISVYCDDIMIEPETLTWQYPILSIPNRHIDKVYRVVLSVLTKEYPANFQPMRVLLVNVEVTY